MSEPARPGDRIRTDTSQQSPSAGRLLAATPVLMLLAHYAAVLPHEFSHSFVAWFLGIKSDPWNIHWGGTSVGNILLLYNIDEKVDYQAALAEGRNAAVALVALAGPGMNGLLYLLARFVAPLWRREARPFVAYLTFWFLLMQLGNLYDYVPVRVAASDGDVRHWIWATHMSPWTIYVVVGYLVLWAMIDTYRLVLPRALDASGICTPPGRALVLITATALLFGYFAIPGLLESDDVSLFVSRTSLLLIPVVILANWRRIVVGGAAGRDCRARERDV